MKLLALLRCKSCRRSSKIPHDGSRPSILGIPKPENSISTSESRTKVPLQRLTAAHMEERRKKSLCYHCDEKWQSGHQCKGARIFLLGVSFSQELPSSSPHLWSWRQMCLWSCQKVRMCYRIHLRLHYMH